MKKLMVWFWVFVLLGLGNFVLARNKKENFRFRLNYRNQVLVQKDIDESGYSVIRYKNVESWLGNYYYYLWFWDDPNSWLAGTGNELLWKPGDKLSLYQYREVTRNEAMDQSIGLDLELRIWEGLWIGLSWFQAPKFYLNSIEQEESLIIDKIDKVIEWQWNNENYYEYWIESYRRLDLQKTKEKFSTTNWQIFAKYEIPLTEIMNIYFGAGVEWWRFVRKSTVETQKFIFYTWRDEVVKAEAPVENFKKEKKNYFRSFLLLGYNFTPGKGVRFGAQAKLFGDAEGVIFSKDSFLIPFWLPEEREWVMKPKSYEADIFLSFGF